MPDDNRDAAGHTTAGLFDRLAAGEPSAVNDLLIHFRDRLHRLTKKLFRAEGRLPDLYQTDDVEQGAAIRLVRALEAEKPTAPLQFMRLAATCVRRELCDLGRKEYGPHGDGGRVYANRLGEQGEGTGWSMPGRTRPQGRRRRPKCERSTSRSRSCPPTSARCST